jgi:4-aminobutyrate aminotransferase
VKAEKRKIPGDKSAKMIENSMKYEPSSMADQVPVVWDKAEGVWVYDVDGNQYIDFTSGVLVTNVGHSHPHHVKAVQDQAARLMNCYSFPTPERINLAQQLIELLPDNIDKIFLLTTGSEAVEASLRIAKRFTKKHEVLAFYGAFHGRTYGPMSVSGSINTRRNFGPALPGGVIAPYGNCYRCFYDKKFPDCEYYCISVLDTIIESSSSGDVGTVITEPYQGAAGFVFPPEGWLKKLEVWARERDLVLIIDEVQSSFGRTGKMFAIEWENIKPQMICLGKGIGSGVPTSALGGESKIFECMKSGEMSSTTGGNPLSCAAALAVLEIMKVEHLSENARAMGEFLLTELKKLQKKYEFIGDVRGCGLVMGIEIVKDRNGNTPSKELAREIILKAAEFGLLLGVVGIYSNVIRIAPPLVIKHEECEKALEILDHIFIELK